MRYLKPFVALLLSSGCLRAQSTPPAPARAASDSNPMDSIRRLPGYRPAHDTLPLLSDARIATLPAAERAAWTAYVERSRATRARDTAAMNAELRAAGAAKMTRAAYAHDFSVEKWMTPQWFAGDSARAMGESILSYQAPNGGWSKHVDFTKGLRARGQSYFGESTEWSWISTIDNASTTSEMEFLALLDAVRPDPRYRQAFLRGLSYLAEAQLPTGCWPQVYPLMGSYHDAATFNDDATVHVLELMRDVASGETAPFVPADERARADSALSRGVECLVNSQYVFGGQRQAWGQQHDPVTLQPVAARSYELESQTPQESANILRFLMSLRAPGPRVVTAVHAGAAWLKKTQLHGYSYRFDTGLRAEPGAGPLWARLTELGTDRPIFSNRDGVKLYDWSQLTDRRTGYGWYTYAPANALKRYDSWSRKHPK